MISGIVALLVPMWGAAIYVATKQRVTPEPTAKRELPLIANDEYTKPRNDKIIKHPYQSKLQVEELNIGYAGRFQSWSVTAAIANKGRCAVNDVEVTIDFLDRQKRTVKQEIYHINTPENSCNCTSSEEPYCIFLAGGLPNNFPPSHEASKSVRVQITGVELSDTSCK